MIAALSSLALFLKVENANAFSHHPHRSMCMSGNLGFGSDPHPNSGVNSVGRRSVVIGGTGGIFGGIFGGSINIASADEGEGENAAPPKVEASSLPAPAPVVTPPPPPAPTPPPSPPPFKYKNAGPTNEVVKTVEGIKRRRLGGTDILVSEMGLGTQRWGSTDYNAPTEKGCFQLMDTAILKGGINLIDTAEQYPIPTGYKSKEGDTERITGKWMKDRKIPRENIVIATKITGGRNITPQNIVKSCESSLKRLNTDYIDVYQLHWPQRYSPQSNWGQSLQYNIENDSEQFWRAMGGPTSFEDMCLAMEDLIQKGKIRGWGLCNDNAYGLTACTRTAKMLGTTPPCSMQGDFSLIDRKSDENGLSEAASKFNENVGFMGYNVLAGGMLTGKYLEIPPSVVDNDEERAKKNLSNPRGRMDTRGWGGTLYRYRSDAALNAIKDYNDIAKANNMKLTELSLRWARQRNLITTCLVGHSCVDQLEETMAAFKETEPLSKKSNVGY